MAIGPYLSTYLPPSLPLCPLYSHEIPDQLRPLLMSFQLNDLRLHLVHEPRPIAVLGQHNVWLLPPHLHPDLVPSETTRSCQLAATGQRSGVQTKTVKKVVIHVAVDGVDSMTKLCPLHCYRLHDASG